jgi:hypothetical protein
VAVVANAFADFPLLLVDGVAGVAGPNCPLGGNASRVCNATGVPRDITATFDNCHIPAPSGSVIIDGTVTFTADNGTCPNVLLSPVTQAVSLRLQYLDSEGAMQRAVAAQLNGAVSDLRGINSPCFFTGISAVVSGVIQTQVAGGAGVDAMLTGTEVIADVTDHSAECLPLASTQSLEGGVTFTDFPAQRSYSIAFETYELARVATAFSVELEVAGKAGGLCFGGGATLSTTATLQLPLSDVCPVAGTVVVETTFAPLNTLFYGEGGVEVDEDGDGEPDATYPSCTAAPACG